MVPNGYTSSVQGHTGLTHHFFLIFDIRALWRSVLSAREPECQKLKKNGGLDQYGPERFGRLILPQSEKCRTERVNESVERQERVSRSSRSFSPVDERNCADGQLCGWLHAGDGPRGVYLIVV